MLVETFATGLQQHFWTRRILADTPFPFPWAQLLTLFLVCYAASLPFLVVAFVSDVWTAAALTFVAVLTYWSTNEVENKLMKNIPRLCQPCDGLSVFRSPELRQQQNTTKKMLPFWSLPSCATCGLPPR